MKNALQSVDKTVFAIGSIVSLIFIAAIIFLQDQASAVVNGIIGFVMSKFGFVYLMLALVISVFCIFLCCTKYGSIRLGKEGEKPEFSTFSWLAMMFTSAMGVAIVFFGASEPMTLFANPPFEQAYTAAGAQDALRMAFFQNGVTMWASYTLFGIAIGYFNYRKGKPALLRYTLEPIVGKKATEGLFGKCVDGFAIVSTVFGISAALSVCTTQIATGLEYVYGIQISSSTNTIIITIIAAVYLLAAVAGLKKGISLMSDINSILAIILLIYMTLVGPTGWIFKTFMQVTGKYLNELLTISTFTDAFAVVQENTGYDFIGAYPIMYVAWYCAWTTFVGSFIAKVSRGRTIREVILGSAIVPAVLELFWFVAFGGSGIYSDLFLGTHITEQVAENSGVAMFVLLEQTPLPAIAIIIAFLVVFAFFVTTADSSTYIAAVWSCHGTNEEPKNWVKMYWGIIIAVVAAVFIPIGGVQVSRQLCLVMAIPIMIAAWLLIVSLIKELRKEKFTHNVVPIDPPNDANEAISTGDTKEAVEAVVAAEAAEPN